MSRKPLLWRLFPAYFMIALVSVIAFSVYASNALRSFYHAQLENDLRIRIDLIRREIEPSYQSLKPGELESLTIRLARFSGSRLTIIRSDGLVLSDSEHDPTTMENHSDRPEVRRALMGKVGTSRRISPTLGYTMLYVAIPLRHDNHISGVLRCSIAAKAPDAAPAVVYQRIIAGALLIGILAGIASLFAVIAINKPLLIMKVTAERFAEGDFSSRVPSCETEEFADLGDTLNRMAAQLDRQMYTITRQASEQQAILSSMREAVVAIDNEDRVLILNAAAEELLATSLAYAKGKTIQETIRNPELQRYFEMIHDGKTPPFSEITFRGGLDDKVMQAIGSALMDAAGKQIGMLVVLNDITQTRWLETMRKNFVANVSHELKTPITSIKGFVETLREGTVSNPVKSREFLDIVARQADRLHAIIEDLLSLSTIEQKADDADVDLRLSSIREIIDAVATNCRNTASESGSTMNIECAEDLVAPINAPLVEQAVTNLVDNAIKYSSGSDIHIKAEKIGNELAIHIADNGPGIDPEHLPRLFERFYRIDKARSRKQGGTGLGLAIVKHIAQAHKGRVEVKSVVGQGSVFSIFLPCTATSPDTAEEQRN